MQPETMIRMLAGMWLRRRLTERFDPAVTAMTAPHMTSEVSILVVTARAEQMPRTCSAIGLLLNSGSIRTRELLSALRRRSFRVAGSRDRRRIRAHPSRN